MVDVIAALLIVLILAGACFYIYKEKKKGARCIGCPMAGECEKAKAACECSAGEKK